MRVFIENMHFLVINRDSKESIPDFIFLVWACKWADFECSSLKELKIIQFCARSILKLYSTISSDKFRL